jgi:hypothetical protein
MSREHGCNIETITRRKEHGEAFCAPTLEAKMMRKIRTLVGRMLVFHTSALPKRIGIPVRRMGRKILFGRKPGSRAAYGYSINV